MQQLNRKQDILQEGVLNKHALKITAIKRALVYVTLISFLSGCIMVPKTHEFQEPRCELTTKKLTVDIIYSGSEADVDEVFTNPIAFLGTLMVLPFSLYVSTIVSGSIMVAGNTIHWIEQEGSCDDGKIKNAISGLSGSLSSAGGWVVTSSKQIIDWINFWKNKEDTKDIVTKEKQPEEQTLNEEGSEQTLDDTSLSDNELIREVESNSESEASPDEAE